MPDCNQPGEVRAAGVVLWRPSAGGPEVALVHRPRYDDWSFAKGKRLPGEHVLVTAVREVSEETGVRVVLGRRLSPASYLSESRPNRVDYWAARPALEASPAGGGASGAAVAASGADPPDAAPAGFVPNAEADDRAWLPLGAARDRLTDARDAEVLDEFASGPATTTTLILVRHTSARSKRAWRDAGHPDDLTRPLTTRGQAQATHLATLLSCFGPARVISSAAQRCVAAVGPYATLAGAEVETEPAFTLGYEDAPDADTGMAVTTARQRIAELAAAGKPAVICAHRENLPSLLAWACDQLGAPVPPGPPLAKGAFWVLHASAGRLVCAERHHLGT